MVRIIKKITPTKLVLPKKKRVAAYARVSSGKDAMLHSLSAQVSYYSDYIQRHGDWQYVRVYTDEALTGTKDDREQFQKLLADCRAGLIDMIIEVVRSVFRDYIDGRTTAAIARNLQANGIPTRFGGKWSVRRIIGMLTNEKYVGNALLQKKYVSDHLTKTLVRNHGQLPKYYAEGTHEGIIDEEIFRQAQVIYERNKQKATTHSLTTQRYPLSGRILCSHCGKNYKRKITHGRVSWNCSTFLKEGKDVCHTKQIPEETLYSITTEVQGFPTLMSRF